MTLASCSGDSAEIAEQMTQVAIAVQDAYFSGELATVNNMTGFTEDMFGDWASAVSRLFETLSYPFPQLEGLYLFSGILSDGASTAFATANGPGASQWVDVDAWDILDDELRDSEASADEQVTDALALAADGVSMSEETVLSDWGRLSTVATKSQGDWAISSDDLSEMANLYVISTRLQIWEAYASSLWSAARIGIDNDSSFAIGKNAASLYCQTGGDSRSFYTGAYQGGLPAGLGGGPQYWPVTTLAPSGTSVTKNPLPDYDAYLAYETSSPLDTAPAEAFQDIFANPGGTSATATSAGAYGPWFWDDVFDLTKEITACGTSPTIGDGGFYGVD